MRFLTMERCLFILFLVSFLGGIFSFSAAFAACEDIFGEVLPSAPNYYVPDGIMQYTTVNSGQTFQYSAPFHSTRDFSQFHADGTTRFNFSDTPSSGSSFRVYGSEYLFLVPAGLLQDCLDSGGGSGDSDYQWIMDKGASYVLFFFVLGMFMRMTLQAINRAKGV